MTTLTLSNTRDNLSSECPATGVGGTHSEAWYDDGECQFCGADATIVSRVFLFTDYHANFTDYVIAPKLMDAWPVMMERYSRWEDLVSHAAANVHDYGDQHLHLRSLIKACEPLHGSRFECRLHLEHALDDTFWPMPSSKPLTDEERRTQWLDDHPEYWDV